MALFQFSREATERYANEQARKHVAEQLERERAGAARQEADNAAAAPEPRPAKPVTAAEAQALGVPETDPWLQSLERLEQRAAAGQNCPQNGQVRAAGPGNETEPNPSSTDIATHKKTESVHSAQPSKEQVRRFEDRIMQVLANVPAATRHDVRRAVHADRHPEAFREAWKHLVHAGRILQTHSQGRRELWICPDR